MIKPEKEHKKTPTSHPFLIETPKLDISVLTPFTEALLEENYLYQEVVEAFKRLTSDKIKRAAFGQDCNVNLKIIAREGSRKTLDNTTDHHYDVTQLQNLSVLVKALQQNHEKVDNVQIITNDTLQHYQIDDLVNSFIAPPFTTSCHRIGRRYDFTPQRLIEEGFNVLLFQIGKFNFRCYTFYDEGCLFFSDLWCWTKNKQCINQCTVSTKILLDGLGLKHTNSDLNLDIRDDRIYVNPFNYSIGNLYDEVTVVFYDERNEAFDLNMNEYLCLDDVDGSEYGTYEEFSLYMKSALLDFVKNLDEHIHDVWSHLSKKELEQSIVFKADYMEIIEKIFYYHF